MSDSRSEKIILVSDGKPGGITHIYLDEELGKNAKKHGFNVSVCEVTEKKGHPKKGKANK